MLSHDTTRTAFAAHLTRDYEPLFNALVLRVIRQGPTTEDQAYTDVEVTLRERLRGAARFRNKEEHSKLDHIIYLFEHFPDEAYGYVAYYVAWERLTPDQKATIKSARAQEGIGNHQRQQPASEKQIAYLRSLGYSGPVASKKHASDIIEAITKRGAA